MNGFNPSFSRNPCLEFIPFCRFIPVFIVAAILLMNGCSEKEQNRPIPEVPVKTAIATQKDVPEELSTIGTVEAYSVVNITSRVDGQVMKIHIKEGQDVTQGQLLFNIDERPYQAMMDAARSALKRDRIRLAKAKKDAVRYTDLLQKDYVTTDQAEQAQTDAEALESAVQGDEAALDNANLNVSYCRITSPINGRAGAILIHEGNLVKSNDNTKSLMVINQIQPIYVRFSVPEQRLSEIQRLTAGQDLKVLVSPPGSTTEAKEGHLTFINNTVNPNTGTIDLKASFDNKDNGLWPGRFVNVVLIIGTYSHAVVVPSEAIQMGQQGSFVFVVKDDLIVEIRKIIPGTRINHETVIEEGIAAGEQVVTDGQLRLFPGAKVIVKNDTQTGGEKNK
jgi:multidrug efflux system membrane fusion protein